MIIVNTKENVFDGGLGRPDSKMFNHELRRGAQTTTTHDSYKIMSLSISFFIKKMRGETCVHRFRSELGLGCAWTLASLTLSTQPVSELVTI